MSDMETRVARLESSARRWRLVAVGLGLALLGVAGLGAAQQRAPDVLKATRVEAKTLRAERLMIVGDNGEVAYLGITEGDGGALWLRDAKGTERVKLIVDKDDAARLAISDRRGRELIEARVDQVGQTGIPMFELSRWSDGVQKPLVRLPAPE